MNRERMIAHVDMDAFYASVEQRDNPSLIGKPTIVGGSSDGRGVVSAASYEARVYGVHSAMSAKRAKQLCPHANFIRPRIDHYASISRQIRMIFESFTPIVEPLSLDEAFLDLTGTQHLFGNAETIGQEIKKRIFAEVKLVASVGIGPSKFIAKIASDVRKPDALVIVQSGEIQNFLDPLPVSRLWGVGKIGTHSLKKISISTIGQLRNLSEESLIHLFGKQAGPKYWQLCNGVDDRPVIPDREAKSISNETTFSNDISDREELRAWLFTLVEQVARRLRRHDHKGKSIEVKLRYSDFTSITRSLTLPDATNITHELLQAASELFDNRIPPLHLPARLIGFGVSHFDSTPFTQRMLFDEPEKESQRNLDNVTDEIAKRFGKSAIQRAQGRQTRPEKSNHPKSE